MKDIGVFFFFYLSIHCLFSAECKNEKCAGYVCETISWLLLLYYILRPLILTWLAL